MSASEPWTLYCHPATPANAVASVTVRLWRTPDIWRFDYLFVGDPERIVLPSPTDEAWPVMATPVDGTPGIPANASFLAESGFAEGLWQHTCAEAFVTGTGSAYREFNFSPSGRWAIFDFADERRRVGALSTPMRPPQIAWWRENKALRLIAELPTELLPAGSNRRAGFCAVVEEEGNRFSYWALMHAADRPDFHKSTSFVCRLIEDE